MDSSIWIGVAGGVGAAIGIAYGNVRYGRPLWGTTPWQTAVAIVATAAATFLVAKIL